MRFKMVLLAVFLSALATWGLAALLMNIAERKQEARLFQKCPCPSESCPHRGHAVVK